MNSLNFETNRDELEVLVYICEWGIDWDITHESWQPTIEKLKDHAKELLKAKNKYFDLTLDEWGEVEFLKGFETNVEWGSLKGHEFVDAGKIVDKIESNVNRV